MEAASKAQQRVAVLESEVTALATQAEQAGVEVAEAQEVPIKPFTTEGMQRSTL